ncbi:MAG: DNA gyrase subunit B, partial [Planctomycetota bacterium]
LLLCFFYRQMYPLVAGGHVYVAQPPLFRVQQGKKRYYVQTDEEMKSQLLARGLEDSRFVAEDGREVAGDEMKLLCQTLAEIEDAIVALERRGISLKGHAMRLDPVTNRLPAIRLISGADDEWFQDEEAMLKYMETNNMVLDDSLGDDDNDDLSAESLDATEDVTEDGQPEVDDRRVAHKIEMYEVHTINAGLKDLQPLGVQLEDLTPIERTGATTPRFELLRGEETRRPLEDLRSLLAEVRAAGEKGLSVTRFKGLGEMNAEELRETTLIPENRTLVKVNLDDAGAADDMFRLMMGDKVEPRREYIEKHALDVRNLDV